MSEILFHYQKVDPTTWVYLSSLLMIGLYFKFGRFWSVRNLDLVLLILLAPGLLIAQYGSETRVSVRRVAALQAERGEAGPEELAAGGEPAVAESAALTPLSEPEPSPAGAMPEESPSASADQDARSAAPSKEGPGPSLSPAKTSPLEEGLLASARIERFGFLWLYAVAGVWLVRLLLDPTMVRRPLLEPNLTTGGLIFIGVSLFVFLMANVWASQRFQAEPAERPTGLEPLVAQDDQTGDREAARRGPGYALLNLIPSIPTMPLVPQGVTVSPQQRTYAIAAKVIAVLCHLAVVLGIVAIGYWHFGNTKTGAGVAALYLMLPYTAQMTGYIDHVIPAALLVWAILCYRRPLTSGMLLGVATGLVYYPLFLLPLWVSFYWRRGLMRFAVGVLAALVALAVGLALIPHASYWENLQQMFGLWPPQMEGLQGIWGLGWNPVYRIPVLAAFVALTGTLALWPPQKNLGTLLSCSAAVMVATQFWHGYGGGLYIGWYLPLTLLTVFRPNLEDRVALAVLGEGWNRRRAPNVLNGYKAA